MLPLLELFRMASRGLLLETAANAECICIKSRVSCENFLVNVTEQLGLTL